MEGARLQAADIDSERMVIHIHGGKGKRDRYVALPNPTLIGLRECWKTHGSPQWLFPARNAKDAGQPITGKTLQRAFSDALRRSGIRQKGPCPYPETLCRVRDYAEQAANSCGELNSGGRSWNPKRSQARHSPGRDLQAVEKRHQIVV